MELGSSSGASSGASIGFGVDFMVGNLQPIVACRQQLIRVSVGDRLQPMVVLTKQQCKDRFSERLNEAVEKARSEEHTSELQSPDHLVCRLLLEKKKY